MKKLLLTVLIILHIPFSYGQDSGLKIRFSHEHGIYTSAFTLTVTAEPDGARIRYTIDGSDPRFSVTARDAASPANIYIDPFNSSGRDKAPGYIIRACAAADGMYSETETRTYLFINNIIQLSPDNQVPGSGWLVPWTHQQQISYGLDPDVYNNPAYKDKILEAFTSLPSVSLVTDLKNLFNADSGIYVNAKEHGREWERGASLELINPDSSEGFQINCGVRVRGGYSRNSDNPKHAFRLFFRSEYGKGKLKYPIFGDEGTDTFEKFDLQTAQNYSWSFYGDDTNTFLREIFSRDTQRDMGQPYTRGRFCHLYINGTYFGLFQFQERSEANFGASYFGGSEDDYDVIKVDTGEDFNLYTIEATDGTLDKWQELYNGVTYNFNSEVYFKLQGLNPDGTPNPTYTKLLDVDNLIDYMLITFFTGDFDGPISGFSSNTRPNNFYAIINRANPDGFKFFRHDAEHSLFNHPWGTDRTGPFNAGSEFKYSNPQWIHQKLSGNKFYRLRFADRVYKHFNNGGALTLKKNLERLNKRKAEIEKGILAESARWGDSKISNPRTPQHWLSAVNFIVYTFLPNREGTVLNQLTGKTLYTNVPPPQFNRNGGEVDKGFQLTITSGTGDIYYTTDGTDPYSPAGGGSVSATAVKYTGPVIINKNVTVKTRAFNGNSCGILNEAVFTIIQDLSALKITELHYHPLDRDTISDRMYEFIELKNGGVEVLDLTGVRFVKGISYSFTGKELLPGEFIVLASSREHFNERYGFFPYDVYEGQLDNSGEAAALTAASRDTIFSFVYDDKLPWPEEADGSGYSLVLSDKGLNDPSLPEYWARSAEIHGSPGKDDPVTAAEQNIVPLSFNLLQNYPNPFNPVTSVKFSLGTGQYVNISVYNILGVKVAELQNGYLSAGEHNLLFNASHLAGGVYFCSMRAGAFNKTIKMTLLK